jgi:hypothetical protein
MEILPVMDREHESSTHSGSEGEDKPVFVGEESDDRSSPEKDLAAATTIAVLSLLAMFLATQLRAPDSIFTAPGLLPLFTGFTLLLMAVGLGIKAMREGGARVFQGPWKGIRNYCANEETRRVLLLIGIIIVYVILVDRVTFDLRVPTGVFDLRFSSYELLSIVVLTLILRLFWRSTLLRCFLVSGLWIIALASVFRYGFHILLPGSG